MSRPADAWQEYALCGDLIQQPDAEVDLLTWFPPAGRNPYRRARTICADCPVRPDCLEYALRTEVEHFRFGMWGGASPEERTAIAATRMAEASR